MVFVSSLNFKQHLLILSNELFVKSGWSEYQNDNGSEQELAMIGEEDESYRSKEKQRMDI